MAVRSSELQLSDRTPRPSSSTPESRLSRCASVAFLVLSSTPAAVRALRPGPQRENNILSSPQSSSGPATASSGKRKKMAKARPRNCNRTMKTPKRIVKIVPEAVIIAPMIPVERAAAVSALGLRPRRRECADRPLARPCGLSPRRLPDVRPYHAIGSARQECRLHRGTCPHTRLRSLCTTIVLSETADGRRRTHRTSSPKRLRLLWPILEPSGP